MKTKKILNNHILVVKESTIPDSGLGLITETDIKKGELITEYEGDILTMKEVRERYGDRIHTAPSLSFVSYKKCVDALYNMEAFARYANDANGFITPDGMKNNSEFTNIRGVPYIKATKNIKAGSEILVDYGGDYWKVKKAQLAEEQGLAAPKSKPLDPKPKKSLKPKKKKKKRVVEQKAGSGSRQSV